MELNQKEWKSEEIFDKYYTWLYINIFERKIIFRLILFGYCKFAD
jgi:hypothetical protein